MSLDNLVQLFARHGNAFILDTASSAGACQVSNDYDGRIGARVSSIFVILVGSSFGALFPVIARRRIRNKWMERGFFFAKYFGSGVIIATAFIHLLAPASKALTNPCLTGPITEYDWAEGICLMMVFILFFVELMTVRYASFGHSHHHDEEGHDHGHGGHGHETVHRVEETPSPVVPKQSSNASITTKPDQDKIEPLCDRPEEGGVCELEEPPTHLRGEDHLGHGREHQSNEDLSADWEEEGEKHSPESYVSQMTALFILEFGVVFHSVFIGLTLAVAGEEFTSLYVVLVFHQTFEGLGLGTRLASAPWPRAKRWTPYILAMAFGLATPIAIAVGLIIRKSFLPGSQTNLIVNGVFDALSAGILIYTGLVELMAHEFMFSPRMRKAKLKTVLSAYFQMCLGAGLMALLGKWA
jgi:zinc transporter 1/2/3